MKEEFSYLFFEYESQMYIVGFHEDDLELLKENGETNIGCDREHLTQFYKRKTGHYDEIVDFCYISDQYDDEFLQAFTLCEKSDFDEEYVKKALEILLDTKEVFFDNNQIIINVKEKKVLKSNLKFSDARKSDVRKHLEKRVETSVKNTSDISKYYTNKTNEYKNL